MKLDRSPASVDALCAALKRAHARFPDQRVGQLISNVTEGDPFYVENDLLARMLDAYADRET